MSFARPTTRIQRRTCSWAWIYLFVIGFQLPTQPAFATQSLIQVTTADELKQALQAVQPGQIIQLADGIYTGEFKATVSGTAEQPITVQGTAAAILDGKSTEVGYTFYLNHVNYWTLTGFTLRNAAKGVMLDNADHNRLDNLHIHTIGQEAVHFRTCSANNILQNSEIRNTGVITPGFGEGVYIGSDANAWPAYSCDADGRDKSHANQILNNTFGPDVRAEAIDVKEGTVGGKIIGNHFDASGLSGENFADSWVDLKGNDYHVARNEGWRGATPHLRHGFETHFKAGKWGRNNFFYANLAHVEANGYGFHIDTDDAQHGNRVCADNSVFGADKGVTNIAVPYAGQALATSASNDSQLAIIASSPQPAAVVVWLPLITKPPC